MRPKVREDRALFLGYFGKLLVDDVNDLLAHRGFSNVC